MLGLKRLGRSRNRATFRVGIAADGTNVALVALACDRADERMRVVAWEVVSAQDGDALGQELTRFVAAHRLHGVTARITLSPSDYNLKRVERPAHVPDEELADATRWLIRDLVEVDIESAAIAAVTIPDRRAHARAPHMFVVAARDEAVASASRATTRAGLVCGGFEVVETAMLALESNCGESVAASALARIDAKASMLILASEGRLFLARPLRIDVDAMEVAAQTAAAEERTENAGPIHSALEPLLLDVQRSLDYYEAEFGRAPATRLTLLPGSIDVSSLAPALAETLRPLRVEPWSLERAFEFPDSPPTRHHGLLTLACGAAVADPSILADALIPKRLRTPNHGFGLARVLQLAATLVLAVALYGAHQYRQLGFESAEVAALATREQALTEALAAAAARSAADAQRRAAIDPNALRARRDALLALMRDLGQPGVGSASKFSEVLTALARQDRAGVWLERIEVSSAGRSVSLQGRAVSAEGVPALLERLRDEPAFAGRRFGKLAIEREGSNGSPLRFDVATRAPEAESPGDLR